MSRPSTIPGSSRCGRRMQHWVSGTLRLVLFVAAISASLLAQSAKPTEYEVKAAYLFNFGKFVRWPEAATADRASFFICVVGKDPFGKSLDSLLEGATWEGKPISARRIVDLDEASTCNLIFLGPAEAEKWEQLLPTVAKQPILTVSDEPLFSRHGGIIQFILSEQRVRFEVNLDAAEKAGVVLDSQLLKVALHVRKTGGR